MGSWEKHWAENAVHIHKGNYRGDQMAKMVLHQRPIRWDGPASGKLLGDQHAGKVNVRKSTDKTGSDYDKKMNLPRRVVGHAPATSVTRDASDSTFPANRLGFAKLKQFQ